VRQRAIAWSALLALGATGALGAPRLGARPQELPVEALLARVPENYRNESMSVRFEQRQEVRPGMPPKIATGTLQMRSPGRMRLEYDESGRTLVMDGEKLYWYLPDEMQVHVRAQDEFSQRGNALLYLSGQGDMRDDFAVSGTEWRTKLSTGNIQLLLDPLVPDTNYSQLMLEVEPDAAIIVRLVSFGLFGEPNEFRFTEIERGADLAEELFQFTIPPGVEVENLGN